MPRLLVAVACLVLALIGCSPERSKDQTGKTVHDVIEHFRKDGVPPGKYVTSQPIEGAVEAQGYEGDFYRVVVFRFETEQKAMEVERSGVFSPRGHRNGRFILFVLRGENVVAPAFRRF